MDKSAMVSGGDLEVTQVFDLLESSNLETVQEIKAEINETFNKTRESWLVAGLFEYYLHTGSNRCVEILCGISKEPHDKFLVDKITEGIRSPSKETRRQSLTFLGHVISKQPSWLYKITQMSLFRELIRLLKTETDVVVLLTGLLSVIMIIPTIPSYVCHYITDIFDVFGRLATWSQMSSNVPKEHVLHLQVGLYSLFHRLYALYPCNFLSYLRYNFSSPEKRIVFFHTIMPMLEKVKMHPALVTATKEGELNQQRWRSKEYHEIIAECSKISLDVYESSFPEEVTPTFTRLSSIDFEGDSLNESSVNCGGDWTVEALLKLPASTLISQAMRSSDLTSLASYLDDTSNTAPPTPLSVGGSSSSIGPASMIINKTSSPPEAAMEATPENTPIKERSQFKMPPTSPAVMQLNFANIDQIKEKYAKPFPLLPPIAPTPFNSVPSSPLPVPSNSSATEFPTPSHTLLVRRDSIFDSVGGTILRKDSLIYQRLQKVQIEQQQQQQQSNASPQNAATDSGVPASTTAAAKSNTSNEGLSLTHRKASIPSPIVIPSQAHEGSSGVSSVTSDFFSDRDKPTGGPLTPMLPTSCQHQGLLDPDLSLIALDEDSVVDNCQTTGCPKGGLHMADHKQMIAFAKRVSRLRFHSQCLPGTDLNATIVLEYPYQSSPSSTSSSGLVQFQSRSIKRSYSLPNIQKPVITEDEESDSVTDMSPGSTRMENVTPTNPDNTILQESHVEEQPAEQTQLSYEQLFQQILPTVFSPPVDARTLPSPHFLLDLCLMKAASLHNAKGKMDELSLLKGQIALLHGQLLFERHRREAHALRNRRLAGKCREMQTMEEKNNSMQREIHNLGKDIIMLKQEVITQRSIALTREHEMAIKIKDQENKLENSKIKWSALKDDNTQMEVKYKNLYEEFLTLQKESDQKKADLFSLENEVKYLQKYLEMNNDLKSAYEVSQKEILILGELLRRNQESNYPPRTQQRYFKEEMEDLRQTCEEEIRILRNALDNKMSQYEAASGMIQDLEKKLEKREAIIMEQKQILQEAATEHHGEFQEYQEKYETVKADNHKLELEILNLQHQLTLKTYTTRSSRGRITSSPSNGEMSPTGNSNHSDVDSATSAAGYQLSPDRNACFFGSPQFDKFDTDEMKDLQKVLDHKPGPSSGARRASYFKE